MHQRLRKAWAAKVAAGEAACARCGRPIYPGQKWDLDHADDRVSYLGASHARCNRRAGGRKSRLVRRVRRTLRRTSREW